MCAATNDDFGFYFNRIRPIYQPLFNLVHAITGNCEQAEYCMQYAILDCWAAGDDGASRHGFRESLRSSAVRAALHMHGEDGAVAELDWDALREDEGTPSPLQAMIVQESRDMRRILALRYGCELSLRQIARIVGSDAARLRTLLKRFEMRARRRVKPSEIRRCEVLLAQNVRKLLNQPSPLAPELSSVYRTFQADAASITRSARLPSRILSTIFAVILTLLCMAAFWLAAVLLQPPVLENPAPSAGTELVEIDR